MCVSCFVWPLPSRISIFHFLPLWATIHVWQFDLSERHRWQWWSRRWNGQTDSKRLTILDRKLRENPSPYRGKLAFFYVMAVRFWSRNELIKNHRFHLNKHNRPLDTYTSMRIEQWAMRQVHTTHTHTCHQLKAEEWKKKKCVVGMVLPVSVRADAFDVKAYIMIINSYLIWPTMNLNETEIWDFSRTMPPPLQ